MKKNTNNLKTPLLLSDFFDAALLQKEKEKKLRTAANYRATIKKIQAFTEIDVKQNYSQEISTEWVKRWVCHLMSLHPNNPETVDFYFRNTRAMYNITLENLKNRADYPTQPFAGMKIKKIQPSKRSLPENEVKKLYTPELRKKLTPSMQETLDVLLFILFAQGIVFQDVYNLRWDMIGQVLIRYPRSKTGNLIEICILPEARQIMERYRDPNNPFVFPFLHQSKQGSNKIISEESSLRRVNQHASIIGKTLNLSLPLTTYVLRHTWATLMLESGKPIELISQCLGHSNIRTTQIYLSRISSTKVDSEINDMFNQMLRTNTCSTSKKGRVISTKKETEKKVQDSIVDKTENQDKFDKNRFLFLSKKEKCRNQPDEDVVPQTIAYELTRITKLIFFTIFRGGNNLIIQKKRTKNFALFVKILTFVAIRIIKQQQLKLYFSFLLRKRVERRIITRISTR